MPKAGRVVNKRDLAGIFGVSTQAVDGWLLRGCPVLEKGGPLVGYKFDTAAVAEWRAQQAVRDASSSKPEESGNADARMAEAQAQLAELKLARELGQLVAIDDVEKVWNRLTTACRSRLLSVPTKTAAAARSADTDESARTFIESAITEALDELSNEGIDIAAGDAIADDSGSEAGSGAEATAETEPQPMGGRKAKAQRGGKRRAGSVGNGEG